ncbi:MAG: type I-C CRISPR-associated protein Cas8c/Csd1 [Lachnospiraceae bacterium]|jgi:CRISPR-associated protein Csd1|nr:type I-C CRISPR-associated protein Cas8c/Csd1 [Lachnospiraceae bacterium]MCI1657032.1 type I-C CRISPR-associated protein Cas8c/Csd1 [Lachnospiraceae bacterium]MCI2195543.1 type I-C CRISPR-associated protein Cas8c/Csd1 [Lachnospiraceae bacterium]
MLINALNSYYDVLEENGKLPPNGYDICDISYLVVLTEDGDISEIVDIKEKVESIDKKGKIKIKYIPKEELFPARLRSTSVLANYVEVRGGYLFGLEYKINKNTKEPYLTTFSGKEGDSEKKRAKLSLQHASLVEEVEKDFADITSPVALAYRQFVQKWDPDVQSSNEKLLALKADLNTKKFAFCLAGHPEVQLQDEISVKHKWQDMQKNQQETIESKKLQCSVIGKILPVAEIHDTLSNNIKNSGINPSLVNFKPTAFQSYGHEQGENACISEIAMKHYTQALNWLLSSARNHTYLDGITLVFWSKDGNQMNDDIMAHILGLENEEYTDEELDAAIKGLLDYSVTTEITNESIEKIKKHISMDTKFYIMGIEPNSSRIQMKFFYQRKFGSILKNVMQHQEDMKLTPEALPVPLWKIKKQLISPKTSHPEMNDTQFLTIFRSIINGLDYPKWCMSTIVRRIRTDQDTEDNKYIKLNDVRAGLVKACLIRHEKEEITMALDKTNMDPAYLCGRLFAVLQDIQEDAASPVTLNRTIKSTYFGTASVAPGSIMPKLLRLSQHHMEKLKRNHADWAIKNSKIMTEILDKLGSNFPKVLNLYDQGKFILGYYQQEAEKYKKKNNN